MLIRKPDDIPSSEITPENVYLSRRDFLGGAAAAALTLAGAPACGRAEGAEGESDAPQQDELTPLEDETRYNKF